MSNEPRVWGVSRRGRVLIRREGRTAVGSNPMAESDRWHDGPNSAQEGVSEQAMGQNRKRAASTEKKISSFLISEAFSIEF